MEQREKPNKTAGRLWQLDLARCAALLNMLAYHGLYDWVYVLGHKSGWYDIFAPGCHVWQQYICWSFILISGFSFGLSRRPWKNGLITCGCAAVLTLVTWQVMPSELILFGVLHFLGAALLLTWLLRPLLQRLPAAVGLAGSAVLFALTNQLPFGFLGFENFTICKIDSVLYDMNWFWLGFQKIGTFYSADYFPLLPWLFLFWCGYFLWRLAERAPALRGEPPAVLRPFCTVGAHTLLVYMLHQPVLYGLTLLLDFAARR